MANKSAVVLDGGRHRVIQIGDNIVDANGRILCSVEDVKNLQDEMFLAFFLIDANLIDLPGFSWDNLKDQTGIDDTASTGEYYDASGNFYRNAGTGDTSTWSKTLDADHVSDLQNNTHRIVIPAADISTSGSKVRVTFNASSAAGLVVDHAAIVERSGETAAGTETPTELLFGGVSGFSISASGEITSDWVDFDLDETKDYLVIIDYDSDGASYGRRVASGTVYYKAGASYNTADGSGFGSDSYIYVVNKIEVNSSVENLVLITESVTATQEPTVARACIFVEPVDAITINEDLKAYVSKDGGSTWDETTLVLVGTHSGIYQYSASVNLTSTGTTMLMKIQIFNNKQVKVHSLGYSWGVSS